MKNMPPIPYKSSAAALLFCIFLGPLGLLYASFWGGFAMILIGLIFFNGKLFFCTFLVWLASCIWGVYAVEAHNRKIYQQVFTKSYQQHE